MKELILAAAGITALISSLSALAGPDWAVIEKARAAKKAETHEAQMRQPMTSDHAAMKKACQEIMQLNEAVAAIPWRRLHTRVRGIGCAPNDDEHGAC
ncbi:hypothetical protein [Cupriavidus metallidurans]|uniref:hypothetical protein n=1 Tax=Cupriavidus metallidurans TaxID=119219 RepID=UPI001BFC6394|nr:hypothetical protein [Cupriavidus metallidurans]QWC88818.1 hypothetical protein KB891_01015 [Cupriavidus metallidurans]